MSILEKAHHGMHKAKEYAERGREGYEKAKVEGRQFKKEFHEFGEAMHPEGKKRPKSMLD